MSGPRRDDVDGASPQPWHVPQVPEGALAGELPEELAEAARRALGVRRPGVAVADIVERPPSEDGCAEYGFSHGEVSIVFRACYVSADLHLGIACPACPGTTVEVMHAGDTLKLNLDDAGAAEVRIAAGLVSVLINGSPGGHPSVQTSWVRLG